MNEPRTDAGKALLDTLRREWQPDPPYHSEVSIVAIEDEARADLLAALTAAWPAIQRCGSDEAVERALALGIKPLATTTARASIEAPWREALRNLLNGHEVPVAAQDENGDDAVVYAMDLEAMDRARALLEGRCQFVSPDGAPCCFRGDHEGIHKVAWIGKRPARQLLQGQPTERGED